MITIHPDQIKFFNDNGYLVIGNILNPEQIAWYRDLYEQFLTNQIDASRYRSDLGAHAPASNPVSPAAATTPANTIAANQTPPAARKENITQIMLLSKLYPVILDQPLHQATANIARQLLGEDMDLDFDMLIDKAPYSNTNTPWHQDCSYWITMPDTRAASCWVALDDAIIDNGCMWYVSGSHLLPVRTHRPAGKGGGALECDCSEEEATPIEITAGSCIWHHGGTLHYSRGNTTGLRRRALITNYRPKNMIAYERERGFDHTGERELRDTRAKDR